MKIAKKSILFLFIVTCLSFKGYDAWAQETHRYTLASNQPAPLVADAGENIFSAPGETVILGGDPAASGGTLPYGYSWEPSTNLAGPEIANPEVTTSESDATYTLTVTDANGCTAEDETTVVANLTTSIIVTKGEIPFYIYPNPARNWLAIRTGKTDGNLALFNSQGKQVLNESLTPYEHRLDTHSLSKGVYLLKIEVTKVMYTIRVLIQ